MTKLRVVRDTSAEAAEPRLRVAIASSDGKSMNAHFGSARRFVIYQVSPRAVELLEVARFDEVSDESGDHRDDAQDRIAHKIAALAGCQLLFVLAIGGPVAAKVIRAGIHPIKLAEPECNDSVTRKVQAMLTGEAPPWMRRVLASVRVQRSMDFLEQEDVP
jgi:nitrogen fixation protein NifX